MEDEPTSHIIIVAVIIFILLIFFNWIMPSTLVAAKLPPNPIPPDYLVSAANTTQITARAFLDTVGVGVFEGAGCTGQFEGGGWWC